MANNFLPYLSLIIFFILVFVKNVQGHSTGLFVFGDSFYDTGNTNYINDVPRTHANIPPYGVTYFEEPTGRFCDGRLISDFIAQYAKLPLPIPFLQPGFMSYKNGVNFACAGAGALNGTFQGTAISLEMQVENYKKAIVTLRQQYGHEKTTKILSKGVYVFNIGANDYFFPLSTNNPSALTPQYVSSVIGNIINALKEIYKLGGRKFAINNVSPLGCFPVVKAALNSNETCVQELQQVVVLHNMQLSQALSELATRYTDLKYGLFDMFENLQKRINSPAIYGFKEAETACCGTGPFRGVISCGGQLNLTTYELCPNPNKYIFWDSVHPSEMTNSQLAVLIWGGISPDIKPYNVKTLFST